jgi:hypothetical protein
MSRRRIFAESQAGGPDESGRMVNLNETTHPIKANQPKLNGSLKMDSSSLNVTTSQSATAFSNSSTADRQISMSKGTKAAYALPQLHEERRKQAMSEMDPITDDIFMGQAKPGMQESVATSYAPSAQRPLSRQGSAMKNMELKLVPLTGDADVSPTPWTNQRPSSSQRPLSRTGSSAKVHIDLGSMSGGKVIDSNENVSGITVPRVDGMEFSGQRMNSFTSRSRGEAPSMQESSNRLNQDSASWPSKFDVEGGVAGSRGDANTSQGLESNQLTSQGAGLNVVKISSDYPMRLGNTSGSYRASNRAIAGVEQYSAKIKATSGKYIQQRGDQNNDVDLEDPNGPDCITHLCLMFR